MSRDLTADESRLESMWHLRNKEHLAAIAFHPIECRALRELSQMHEGRIALSQSQPIEETPERSPMVRCSVCGDPTFSASELCGSHRPNAGQFPKK